MICTPAHVDVCLAVDIDSDDEKLSAKPVQKRVSHAHPEDPSWDEKQDDDSKSDSSSDFDEDRLLYVKGDNRQGIKSCGIGSSTTQAANRISAQLQAALNRQPNSSGYSHAVKNSIRQSEAKAAVPRRRGLTQDTRATVDQVLDPRTVLFLEKLLKRNIFTKLFGCVSAGKEANVYLGQCLVSESQRLPPNASRDVYFRAIKVFRTSILGFKDRARYVEGEFRFRRGYAGSGNPRKMVRQWAEKEFRNLRRISVKGVRCPFPIELRGHVLAMSFLGDREGVAAPRLKELIHAKPSLPSSFWKRLYVEVIVTLRQLFQECKLVHGDFSEYNILFHMGHCYVIDVSQAVEQDHPHALDFLKRDCVNVYRFFRKLLGGDEESRNSASDNEEEPSASDDDQETTSERYWTEDMRRYIKAGLDLCGPLLDFAFAPLTPRQLYAFVTEPLYFERKQARPLASGAASGHADPELQQQGTTPPPPGACADDQTMDSVETETKSWPNFDIDERLHEVALVGGSLSGDNHEPSLRSASAQVFGTKLDMDVIPLYQTRFEELCARTLAELAKDTPRGEAVPAEDHVFLNSWIPSHLHQVSCFQELDEEFDRHLQGKHLIYESFLAPKQTDAGDSLQEADADDGRQEADADDGRQEDDADDGSQEADDDSSNSSSGEHADDPDGDGGAAPAAAKFTGKIPEGITAKEWKRMVKLEAREKRKTKTPKYIKKKRKAHAGQSKKR